MTISKDRVKPSPLPDSWKLSEIFTTGVVLGSYLAMMTVIFFWAAYKTDFFPVCLLHHWVQSYQFLWLKMRSMHVTWSVRTTMLGLDSLLLWSDHFVHISFNIRASWILLLAFYCFGWTLIMFPNMFSESVWSCDSWKKRTRWFPKTRLCNLSSSEHY